jgi:hypothetical protein
MSAFDPKRTSAVQFGRIASSAGSACYFVIVIVIGHETTTAARWALLLIVRTLFNDAITVALWTGFHVCLPVNTSARSARLDRRYILEDLRSRFDSEEKRNDRPHQREQPEHDKDRVDAPERQNPSDGCGADHRCSALPCAGNAAAQRAQMGWVDFGGVSRKRYQ